MAKRKYIDYKKLNSELFKRTEGYAANFVFLAFSLIAFGNGRNNRI